MIDITMPRLSDTMTEGIVATWHLKPGDKVSVGDTIAEIETDKAIMEYEAYDEGTVAEIVVGEGQTAPIGAVIATLDDGQPARPSTASAPPAAASTPPSGPATPSEPSPSSAAPTASAAPVGDRPPASPLVRRIARDNGIDLQSITGSGPGGRIIRVDLDNVTAAPQPKPVAPDAPASDDLRRSTRQPLGTIRKVAARRLSQSAREIPHYYLTAVADAEELMALRASMNRDLEAAQRSKVSVNDLIVRAVALALREHPQVNASFVEDTGDEMLVHDRVNVGVAVASDAGLVVPVVLDADQKPVSQISAETKAAVVAARERRLSPDQMSGGTFTVSNLGMYGVESFAAIINPPEGGILAIGSLTREPVVVGDKIQARHRMRYTLSADHRIVDGALGAQFLATLTTLLEHPWTVIA